MKFIFKLFFGFIALLGVGFALVFYLTGDMVTSVDSFFTQVREEKVDNAYQELSTAFKDSTKQNELVAFLKQTRLNLYESASWTSRSIDNGIGTLKGSISTKDGASIPIEVQLVKEDGAWKILHLNRPAAGVSDRAPKNKPVTPPAATSPIPSNDELVQLVQESTEVFGAAMDGKDMSIFHKHISSLWKSQYDVAALAEAYKPLEKIGAKWSSLSKLRPVFSGEPSINSDGVLVVEGYYPTKPQTLTFNQKYITEGTQWKLLGLHLHLKKLETKPTE